MCSSFGQSGNLFAFMMLDTLFSFSKGVVQLPNRLLGGIEISCSRVGLKVVVADVCFLLPLVHVVFSCPPIFEMRGLLTCNRSGTRIDTRPYFVVG